MLKTEQLFYQSKSERRSEVNEFSKNGGNCSRGNEL